MTLRVAKRMRAAIEYRWAKSNGKRLTSSLRKKGARLDLSFVRRIEL